MLGLSSEDAKLRLAEYGPNEIVDTGKVSPLKILIRQIRSNFVIYLLFAAAVISIIVGKSTTSYTIIGVIVAAIATGFVQEFKAEKSIAELKKMIMPLSYVFRDGKKREINSNEIVPGDILVLGIGEKIPADCEIIEAHDVRVNEAMLTGESKEIAKKHILDDQELVEENLLFMGTYIVNGRCLARVTHTGMNTRFGKIAHLISEAEKALPLQMKVNVIAKYMVTIAITVSLATGLLMLFRSSQINNVVIVEILIFIVALSVSAFPEGFPVVLMTTLAIGAKRMSKHNAIVNRMSIIETLGEVSVICADKTGTLTKGEMTVRQIFCGNHEFEVSGTGFTIDGEITSNGKIVEMKDFPDLERLLEVGVTCNDAEIQRTGVDNDFRIIGSPTEGALLILGAKLDLFKESITLKREEEIPFSSDRKMMSIVVSSDDDYLMYAKGAPEVIVKKCISKLVEGKESRLTDNDLANIVNTQKLMADSGYRMLALAYKRLTKKADGIYEDNLVYIGQVAMEDPPRDETAKAIAAAQKAGIRVVMITGDNKDTALSIAAQVGLVGSIVEGWQIDDMSDPELSISVKETTIFARVRPEHKIRIVQAFKSVGETVAMTGDGVNDAPALKEAHVGIAMGKNGTDVSRSASDIILKDDNFATIVTAIREGRTVFNNIRKFVTFQLSCNVAELITLFVGLLVAPLFGWQVPLMLSIQILLMNLVTDNMPAITLGVNPSSNDILSDKPRKNSNILNTQLVRLLLTTAVIMASLTLIAYFVSFNLFQNSHTESRTVAFVTLVMVEIVTAFSFRSFRKTTLRRSLLINKYLVMASILSITVTLLVVYTRVGEIFETVPISIFSWLIVILLAMIMVVVNDIIKMLNIKNHAYVVNTR